MLGIVRPLLLVFAIIGPVFGTVFGVILIPGLYYIFAKLAEGKKLIQDEELVVFWKKTKGHSKIDGKEKEGNG